MRSSLLAEELADLDEKIGKASRKHKMLEGELHAVEAELERLSEDRPRFAAVQDVCIALDRLGERKAADLFWEAAGARDQAAGLVERAKSRIDRFERELSGILEKQESLKKQIDGCLDELCFLDNEVRDAYARDARRLEEYVIEREISPVPDRPVVMPWSKEAESEKRLRKAMLIALLCALFFGTLIPLLRVPAPLRQAVVEVPDRLVSMLQEEPRKAPPKEAKKPEKEQEKKAPEKEEEKKLQEDRPKPTAEETAAAHTRAERAGVLAFRDSFKDLVNEAPAARVGSQARLITQPAPAGTAGQAQAGRSLLTVPSTVAASSGGISDAVVSRTVGHDNDKRIDAVDPSRVQSSVPAAMDAPRPSSSGPRPVRTDEEIQLVFDKYKATLYRMYNAELRRNPTLRGKIVLRITIEPGGEVSVCVVQSNDLASPELIAQIVERVKRFNFGPKEKVSPITILYPIDFLPGAGI